MKRLSFLLVIVVFVAFALFAFSNRAWLSAQSEATPDCGCSTSCMGGKSCSISCPVGKAAHCDCVGGSQTRPQEAGCYCQ